MFFEINVSLHGIHFFATHNRSITDKQKLIKVLPVILDKFPIDEGFEISVSKCNIVGQTLNVNDFIEKV